MLLLASALIILLLIFRKKIYADLALFSHKEAVALKEKLIISYYYPHTRQERVNLMQDCVDQFVALQNRVTKSLFAKYFISHNDSISFHQNQLLEMKQTLEGEENNLISFSTLAQHGIIATSEFSAEALMTLAGLIDDAFPEEFGNALFSLSRENSHLALDIAPYGETDPFHKSDLQAFSDHISQEAFDGEMVKVQIDQYSENLHDL